MKNATFIQVEAGVRYWEDATVNGVDDEDGTLIPFRRGDLWCPVIELVTGRVIDWPQGVTADVHYKVCDEGEYWLLDENKQRIAKYADYYVPSEFLCHGDSGYGEYIILNIDECGFVKGWRQPKIDAELWKRWED